MATLTATGINFGTNDDLNSKRGIFPLHVNDSNACVWIFYQNTTPTGWSKLTTQNNKALRVVSGSGGGGGGTNTFSSTFSPKTLCGVATMQCSGGAQPLSLSQIPSHTHAQGAEIGLAANGANYNPDGNFTGWNGGDVSRPSLNSTQDGSWIRTTPATGVNSPNGESHSHPPLSAPFILADQTVTLNVQYIDIIFCTFDG